MSRYIDADKAEITYSSKDVDKVAELFNELLDAQPTADVVEVVRCKDCKKYNMDDCMMIYGKKMNRNIFANDFCSYGERADA